MELSLYQWIIANFTAFFTGITKTGIAGISTVLMPLMAEAFPAKQSVGVLLPTLISGDILAVIIYRKYAKWRILMRLLPLALIGIVCGYFLMGEVSNVVLKKSMGLLVILTITLHFFMDKNIDPQSKMIKGLGPVFGIFAG
ncbi:MAG: sulfite exporter TauE/SafE family protein, partial [Fibrobacteria bacterium]|nr:sulfite exporter TauE/SafE family protein [Fibrobacteria bacterium]